MKSTVFWLIRPRSSVEIYRRFGGMYLFKLQGASKTLSVLFLSLFFCGIQVNLLLDFLDKASTVSETSIDFYRTVLRNQKIVLYIVINDYHHDADPSLEFWHFSNDREFPSYHEIRSSLSADRGPPLKSNFFSSVDTTFLQAFHLRSTFVIILPSMFLVSEFVSSLRLYCRNVLSCLLCH
jgi:hypothetical protein